MIKQSPVDPFQRFAGPQNLTGKVLRGENLEGVDLTGAILRKADLSDANLRNAILRNTDLREAILTNADLTNANLENAWVHGAKFDNANLQGANLFNIKTGTSTPGLAVLLLFSAIIASLSGFTASIATTFLLYFFFISRQRISFLLLTVIWLFSVTSVTIVRTFLNNLFGAEAVTLHVYVAVALILITVIFVIPAVTADEEKPNVFSLILISVMALMPLLVAGLNIWINAENFLVRQFPQVLNLISGLGSSTHGRWFAGLIGAGIGATFGCYFSKLAIEGDKRFQWLWRLYIRFASLDGTLFLKANLDHANFARATLRGSKFDQASLNGTNWNNAKFLGHACVGGSSYLKHPCVQHLVTTLNGRRQNFDNLKLCGINLEGAKLEEASFVDTDLSHANLKGVNLGRANLKRANVDGADLTGAELTGICLEDVVIGQSTNFDDVHCDFLFLLDKPDPCGSRERRPHDFARVFYSGEFKATFSKKSTLDLLIPNESDPKALESAIEWLVQKNNLDPQYSKLQGVFLVEGYVLIRFEVNRGINKGLIERGFTRTYESAINQARRDNTFGISDRLMDFELANFLTEKLHHKFEELKVHMKKPQVNFHGLRENNGQIIIGNNSHSPCVRLDTDNSQNSTCILNLGEDLYSVDSSIQAALENLEKTMPFTKAKTQVAKAIVRQAESDPSLLQKLKNWGGSLGEAVISDIAKEVLKNALRLLGIALP